MGGQCKGHANDGVPARRLCWRKTAGRPRTLRWRRLTDYVHIKSKHVSWRLYCLQREANFCRVCMGLHAPCSQSRSLFRAFKAPARAPASVPAAPVAALRSCRFLLAPTIGGHLPAVPVALLAVESVEIFVVSALGGPVFPEKIGVFSVVKMI